MVNPFTSIRTELTRLGRLPSDPLELEKEIDGVGRYTAGKGLHLNSADTM